MVFAEWLVKLLAAYAGAGLLFAVIFAIAGIGRVDPAAKGSSAGFRLMVLPGVAVLWPLMMKRWIRS